MAQKHLIPPTTAHKANNVPATPSCASSQSRTCAPDSPEPLAPPPSAGRKVLNAAKWVVDVMVAQWFLIGIGVVIGLAYKFPNVAKTK